MVKKLVKYEMKAVSRVMIPAYIVVLGLAVFVRIIEMFENPSTLYSVVFYPVLVSAIISIVVCLVMTGIYSFIRFYKGMYSQEGYLSLTLPVTVHSHIRARLITSFIFDLIAFAVCTAAAVIMTSGELLKEIFKAGLYILKDAYSDIGGELIVFIIELIVLFFVYTVAMHMLLYMCVSVGQLFKKLRALASFGVAFAVFLLGQIAATVLLVLSISTDIIDKLLEFIEELPWEPFHTVTVCATLFFIAVFAVSYLVSALITKKKLNLE